MSDSTSTNAYRIDPLKGAENYAVWKIKMSDILTDLGLLGYVDGTSKAPEEAALQADWKLKDRFLASKLSDSKELGHG
ncbi:hypothetical protein H0H87_002295 [Tephrocybe sp. NHM501043]|nr:hypothetical protein H0H87_002295 [Tephrocybe sp. NHM501043]